MDLKDTYLTIRQDLLIKYFYKIKEKKKLIINFLDESLN